MTHEAQNRDYRNSLLCMLSAEDLGVMDPLLEAVTLPAQQVLEIPNEPIAYAYFLENGLASVIATDGKRRRIEAGPFGREGMSALPIVMGADRSPNETRMQIGGSAHRIRTFDLRRLIIERPTLQALLLRYVQAFSIQTIHTLMSAGLSHVEVRLARWILMIHDRSDADEIAITHEFMALMLGVRRPGVTVALHVLEGKGLVRGKRGRLIIRDRAGLEELCGGLYGVPELEYARLIGTQIGRATVSAEHGANGCPT